MEGNLGTTRQRMNEEGLLGEGHLTSPLKVMCRACHATTNYQIDAGILLALSTL